MQSNNTGVLAGLAWENWRTKSFSECLENLNQLHEQVVGAQDSSASEKKSEKDEANTDASAINTEFKLLYNRTLVEFVASDTQDYVKVLSRFDDLIKKQQLSNEGTEVSPQLALLLYNQSVVYTHLKRYHSALKSLERCFECIESIDEGISLCICFLMLDVYTRLGMGRSGKSLNVLVSKADKVIAYLESPHVFNGLLQENPEEEDKSASGGKKKATSNPANTNSDEASKKVTQQSKDVVEFNFRIHLFKARLQLLQEKVKGSKKEVKSALEIFQHELKSSVATIPKKTVGENKKNEQLENDTTTATWLWLGVALDTPLSGPGANVSGAIYNTPALVLKANFEYLRQNYKKSIKLLTSCSKSGLHEGIFLNNMACIHHKLGQHGCANVYLAKALKSYQKQKQKGVLGTSFAPEVLYNLGLQQMMIQKPSLAYSCFIEASFSHFNRAKLWLRIAECVIQAFEQQVAERMNDSASGRASSAYSSRSLIQRVIRAGPKSRLQINNNHKNGIEATAFSKYASSSKLLSDPTKVTSVNLLLPGAKRQNERFLSSHGEKLSNGSKSNPLNKFSGLSDAQSDFINGSFQPLSLETGLQATFNVTYLLDMESNAKESDISSNGKATEESPTDDIQIHDDSDKEDTGKEGNHTNVKDSNANTRIAALLSRAYLALCMENPRLCIVSCEELIVLLQTHAANVPLRFSILAHTYYAEALFDFGDVNKGAEHAIIAFNLDTSNGGNLEMKDLRCSMCTNVGTVYMAKGNFHEAEVAFHKALHIVPNSTEALRGLLFLYLKRGQTSAALQILKTRRAVPLAS